MFLIGTVTRSTVEQIHDTLSPPHIFFLKMKSYEKTDNNWNIHDVGNLSHLNIICT